MSSEAVTDQSDSEERFDPRTREGTLMHSEHLGRYLWASQLVGGKRVLDAGCGTGYGSAILAEAGASSVQAIDLSEEAVAQTRARLGDRGSVSVGDVRKLPFPDGSVDVVVCFEVIEHIEDRDVAIREFARVLEPSGVLLISSPNRRTYLPHNPFHVYEYVPEELEQELLGAFAHVALEAQDAWLATTVGLRDEAMRSIPVRQLDPSSEREQQFIVAAACQAPTPRLDPVAVLGNPFEVTWWADQVEQERRRGEESVALADQRAREQATAAAASAMRESEALRLAAVGRDARLAVLGARLLEVEREHAFLVAARGEALAAADLARAERDQFHGERDSIHADRDRIHAELLQALERANHCDRVLDNIKASLSWRVTAPLRRLKRGLRRS